MSDENDQDKVEKNRKLWEEWVPIHVKSEFYGVDNFIAGENCLNPLELSEMGDVEGKNLLHLQCHFGMDTLSWARLGAHVTGMDYSESAIEQANELAARCNLDARFLCCNLYDLPQKLLGQYDIVYTSYGVLSWLHDIPRWAQIAASYVKPGGYFYIAEFHPFTLVFDDDAASLQYRYPYFDPKPVEYEATNSYADLNVKTDPKPAYNWTYRMGDIVTSLIQNGLRLEYLHEYPFSVYQQLPFLVRDQNGIYRFPDGEPKVPLMFSLKASKDL